MIMTTTVKIRTASVGQCFGTVAIVSDAKTGKRLHETEVVCFGMTGAALAKGESYAEKMGWTVIDPTE